MASGRVAARHDYSMSLTTRDTTISARIDGRRVATVTSRTYRDGPAGLASLGHTRTGIPASASASGRRGGAIGYGAGHD